MRLGTFWFVNVGFVNLLMQKGDERRKLGIRRDVTQAAFQERGASER